MMTSSHEAQPIVAGEKFFSFEELKLRIEEHKVATMTDFWIRDCNTLKSVVNSAPRVLQANPDLRYYYIIYNCLYGGKYKTKITSDINRKRKFTGSFRQGCKAEVAIGLSKDGQSLYARKVVNSHNHDLNPSILRVRPGSKAKLAAVKAADSELQCCMKKIVHEGYVYSPVPPMRKGRMYLKCVSESCPGRAKKLMGAGGKCHVVASKPHLHDADKFALQRLEFSEQLIKRAKYEATHFATLFAEEASKFPMLKVQFEQYTDLMASTRVTNIPLPPKSMKDFSFALTHEDWCNRYACNLELPPRELFMGMVKAKGGETAAVFASMYLCEVMNKAVQQIFVDVGYKRLPKTPTQMKFLLSIHLIHEEYSFCGVYAVMSSRNLSACMAVLKFVRDELLPECAPEYVFTGFEAEIQLALHDVFPSANLQASCFYFSKSVEEKCTELQLHDVPQLAPLLQALAALPLLPASLMESGLNAVAATLARSDVGPKPLQLIQFVRFSLLEGLGATDISAHEQAERSHLNLRNWYAELDALAELRVLNSWRLVEILQLVEESHREDHQALLNGGEVKLIHRSNVAVLDTRIALALDELNSGNIGIIDFLNVAAQVIAS